MAKLEQADLRRFAVAGAARRIEELEREKAQILSAFPQLRARNRGTGALDRTVESASVGRKRRRRISAEGRRRISEAQKARWAKQKGEAGRFRESKRAR